MSTTVVLRPNNTAVESPGIFYNPPGPPSTYMSDNDTGTYVSADTSLAYLYLDLGTSTIAANKRVRTVQIRLSMFSDVLDVGLTEIVKCWIRDPTNNKVTPIDMLSSNQAGVTVTKVGALLTSGPDNVEWSQALIDRMYLQLQWLKQKNNRYLSIEEAYVDLVITDRPVVSAVTVTNYTTTTRPTIGFTYTGDGTQGVQSRARFKVFPLAVTTSPGFSADQTTGIAWDSGEVLNSATSATLTSDLANGTSYVAYATAAQEWPGAEGAQWWSTWVPSSTFVIVIVPPPQPTLTATLITGLPDYRARLTITAPINILSLEDSTFEGGTVGTWTAAVNVAVSNQTTVAAEGARSLRLRSVAAGTMLASNGVVELIEPGRTYTFYAVFRAAVNARTCRVGYRFYNKAGTAIGSVAYSGTIVDSTSAWTTVSVNAVAPGSAYTARIYAEVQSTGAASEDHFIDTAGIWAGTTTVWTPGGYKTTTAVTLERFCTVEEEISRGPAWNWLPQQLYSGGALLNSADGFYPNDTANDVVTQLSADAATADVPTQLSTGMIQWRVVGTGTTGLYIGTTASTTLWTNGLPAYVIPAIPGQVMTFSVYLKASASFSTNLTVACVDSSNAVIQTFTGGAVSLSTSWALYSVSMTVPAGSVFARPSVPNTAGASGVGLIVYLRAPRWQPTAQPLLWPGQGRITQEWDEVRSAKSLLLADGFADVITDDYEIPGGRPVFYRAKISAVSAAGSVLASPLSNILPLYIPLPATTLVGDPFSPSIKIRAKRDGRTTENIPESAATFEPLGRDGDALVLSDYLGGYDGELTLGYENALELANILALARSQRALYVQWHDGGIRYIRITGRSINRITSSVGTVTLNYLETRVP